MLKRIDDVAAVIGETYRRGCVSLIEAVKAHLECGRLLKAEKEKQAYGRWLAWVEDNAEALGFGDSTARRLIAGWDLYQALTPDLTYEQAQLISRMLWSNADTIATKWTGDPESYTPKIYIEAAREVMGGIDLDPASNALAQRTVKAAKWYCPARDGLERVWSGRVFLNPPYAQPIVAHFIEKLCASLGPVTQAILLTNNNTDTKWWHLCAEHAAAVCFTAGRINFYKADGSETQPTNGQTFFYFGNRRARFSEVFGEFGRVMRCHDNKIQRKL